MKRVLRVLLVLWLASASSALAFDFKLYGSYWNTSDVDDTFGGGVGLVFPIGHSPVALSVGATYYQELTDQPLENLVDDDEPFFEEESLEVLPVDVGLQLNFADRGPFNLWVEGGLSYFLIDTTLEGIDVDDETGWHIALGSRIGQREGATFFAEALYRSTEATLREEGDGDGVDVDDEVALDLDGFAVNAGVLFTF